MDRNTPGAVWRDEVPGLPENARAEMITIPPGRFIMGSPENEKGRARDSAIEAAIAEWAPSPEGMLLVNLNADLSRSFEGPQHEVRIEYTFALGKYAVTFAEWDAAIAAGANLHIPGDERWGRADRPVININWEDAQAYIACLNDRLALTGRSDAYRLPSEAEWEYACRAGTTTPFYCGATITTSQANYNGNYTYGPGVKGIYRGKTTPVGSFPSNAFGLFDMHGNVFEWCADTWHETYEGAPTDGSAWTERGVAIQRALRGGSWMDQPNYLRSAYRGGNTAERCDSFGFRLARTIARA